MKKLLAAGTALLLLSCNQKTEKKFLQIPDLRQENLKGNITQVETDTYTVDSTGKIGPMDTCCNNIEQYDDAGFTAKYITKDDKGNTKSEQSFTHNEQGMFTGMSTMTNNKKTSSLAMEFTPDGKYAAAKSYDSTGKMDAYFDHITMNENGQITGATQHHPDSSLIMSFASSYEKDFFVGNESKDSTGKVTYHSKIKLNDKNDQEELTETVITKDSSKTTVTTFKYEGWDDHGNWTQQTTYNDAGKPIKIVKRIITYADKKG